MKKSVDICTLFYPFYFIYSHEYFWFGNSKLSSLCVQFVGRCHFDVRSLFRLTLLQSLYVEINVKLLKYKKSKVIL